MSSHTTVFYIHSSAHRDGLPARSVTQRMRGSVVIIQRRNIEKRLNKRLTFLSFSPLLLALWSHVTRGDQPTFWFGAMRIWMKRLAHYLHLLLCGPVCETEHRNERRETKNRQPDSQHQDFFSKTPFSPIQPHRKMLQRFEFIIDTFQ